VTSFTTRDPVDDFETIERELALFAQGDERGDTMPGATLADKPRLVVANKIDALDEPERLSSLEAHVRAKDLPFFAISAATGENVRTVLEALWPYVENARTARLPIAEPSSPSSPTPSA
jgi:GTPase